MNEPSPGEVFRFGVYELDLRAHQLRKQGRRVHLQDQPFELLARLVDRPGEVVSRDELRRHLWPSGTFVAFDDGVNTAVRKVREALGDSAASPRFVETVPKHGYRFIAPVQGSASRRRDMMRLPARAARWLRRLRLMWSPPLSHSAAGGGKQD